MDALTDLAVAAAAGDRAALEAFVRRSQPEVWRLCAALAGRQDADDLTQETYTRAFTAIGRFRADASARTWLLRIARNTAADHVRRQVRRRALVDRVVRWSPSEPTAPDPSDGHALDAAVAALEPDRRLAFVLTQVLGLGYAEAAEVCGCPVGTIRSRVARAREELVAGWDVERRGAENA